MRIFLIGFLFLMAQAGFVAADTLTMTTYYPSPSGSYQRLNITGNIGIGTTAPNAALHIVSSLDTNTGISIDNRSPAGFLGDASVAFLTRNSEYGIFANDESNHLFFWDIKADDARMTLDGDGHFGIGVPYGASLSYILQVNGQPAANGYTVWTNYSDARLKENVADMVPAGQKVLEKIKKLRPVTFNYNALTGYDVKTRARRISGFIAQELQPLFPEMVGESIINGKVYLDTDLSNLPLYLVAAVKELRSENDVLRKEMNDLRADFEKFRKRYK